MAFAELGALEAAIAGCRRCPRLVHWREQVALEKRASFRAWDYWGRPVPGFGDPEARLLVVGLAPAAHGANRTGRMFTGDRSGDWLYRAMHRAGFASQAESVDRNDGLRLADAYVTAIVKCAPPANRPTPGEREECARWMEGEIDLLGGVAVVVTLGGLAYSQMLRIFAAVGVPVPVPRQRFSHGGEVDLRPHGPLLLASYHPSQQNTFTGRLTEEMLDAVFLRAANVIGPGAGGTPLE